VQVLAGRFFAGKRTPDSVIWIAVETVSPIETITFQLDSELKIFKAHYFSLRLLNSIIIPRSVIVLGVGYIREAVVRSLAFETRSQLARIEDSCFASCFLPHVYIPRSVTEIGTSCFDGSQL
jgi:hypothetical protein